MATFLCIGVHERDVGVAAIERMSVGRDDLAKRDAELLETGVLKEVAVLSTCLRYEVYALAPRFHEGAEAIKDHLRVASRFAFDPSLAYVKVDDAAFRHLLRVACGLDSAALGEPEVLGQVRSAFGTAEKVATAGPFLSLVFKSVMRAARRIRGSIGLTGAGRSMADVAIALARSELRRDPGAAIVLGAGDLAEKVAGSLARLFPAAERIVVSRSQARARRLAERVGASAAPVTELYDVLAASPRPLLLVCAARASEPFLDLSCLGRGSEEVVVVDMGLPANVIASRFPQGGRLIDFPAIERAATLNVSLDRLSLERGERMIEAEVARFRTACSAQLAAPVLAIVEREFERLREGVLAALSADRGHSGGSAARQLAPEAREILARLKRAKHEIMEQIKEAMAWPGVLGDRHGFGPGSEMD